jgi:hypothetical protein
MTKRMTKNLAVVAVKGSDMEWVEGDGWTAYEYIGIRWPQATEAGVAGPLVGDLVTVTIEWEEG